MPDRYQLIEAALCRAMPALIDYYTNPDYARVALDLAAEALRNKTFARILATSQAQIKSALVQAIMTSQQQGTVSKSLNIEYTVLAIMAYFDGLFGQCAFEPLTDKAACIEISRTVIRALLKG